MLLRSFPFSVLALGAIISSQALLGDNISPRLSLPSSGKEIYPEVKLRGYGKLSAERKLMAGQPQASVLLITCESEPKAQLLLAKYLSDLGSLEGVDPLPLTTARGAVSARQTNDTGAVAAVRSGAQVYIFTAKDGPELTALIESTIPADTKIDASAAEIPVPMYLDRWDKYGFRFYYGPFVVPQDADHHDIPSYDPKQDFTFAKESGDVGLVVWNTPEGTPHSDGIMNINTRQWVFDAAKKLNLPMGVNLGLEDHNIPFINRYPGDMAPNADGYLGGWYGAMNFGIGQTPAWSADQLQDTALGEVQNLMRKLNDKYDNIVNWLEPHEEMGHGVCDLVDDHGETAKTSFHEFLKLKYATPDGVAKHWSQPGAFKKWEDIPFPELATFMGWNKSAFDLTGMWRVSFDAPYGIDSAKPDLDDSAWGEIEAPGNAIVRALARKPAVFRRHFKLDAAWRAAHPRTWIYLWDFNDTRGGENDPNKLVHIFVNGQEIPETDTKIMDEHSCALEITSALKDGDNVLTVCLPKAMITYRCYLAGEPKVYPGLGPTLNAQWADYSDWLCWSRGQAVRRGAQMIRQVDPDRPITLMAPGSYLSEIKKVAEDYGGIAHDTGGMAGSWGDAWPNMMQSSNLPTDCEPGSGAVDLNDFKRFMGRWSTECTQGVDYFQHIGDVEWKPEVKDYFGKTLKLWHLMGKYHTPQAELAILNSDRNMRLLGSPWDVARDPNVVFSQQRWWSLINQLLPTYPRAGITEDDFARGNVDQFRVVIDGNTTIMDSETVEQIEKWVKNGGTFITYQQTGRHTSTQPDSWPISKLTGYAVTGIDKLAINGDGMPSRRLHLVEGQAVFDPGMKGFQYLQGGAGLSLKKVDPACEDLLQWDDGSIAAGMRHLGKGLVINLGINSSAAIPQVLEYLHVRHVEGSTGDRDVMTRHFISNNGLYDIWVLWNTKDQATKVTLTFDGGVKPDYCRDVNSGEPMKLEWNGDHMQIVDLPLESWQTRAFISPRGQLANASSEWFKLQRGWWKGTSDPGKPIPPYVPKLAVNLADDMAFKPIDGVIGKEAPPEDATLADPKLDDSSWKHRELGVLDIPDYPDVRHGIYRKHFTVPADWNKGKALLNVGTWNPGGGARQYLDGQLIDPRTVNETLGATLPPGSSHVYAIEMWGENPPVSQRNVLSLYYQPDPISRQPIQDNWSFASDYMKYSAPGPLPITTKTLGSFRRMVKIDAKEAGHNVIIHTVTQNNHQHYIVFNGRPVICNGNFDSNVTPWVKFGQDNELVVVCDDTIMQDASVDFYDKTVFP